MQWFKVDMIVCFSDLEDERLGVIDFLFPRNECLKRLHLRMNKLSHITPKVRREECISWDNKIGTSTSLDASLIELDSRKRGADTK